MAQLDHIIVKVNDLQASVELYRGLMGFACEGTDGPFTLMRVGQDCLLQLAPWGTSGFEHYAFAVSAAEFEQIVGRIKAANLEHGPTFETVGANTSPGMERGARGRRQRSTSTTRTSISSRSGRTRTRSLATNELQSENR